jgi:heme oxygenase
VARDCDRFLGQDVTDGRQFFIGRRAGTDELWGDYLSQMSVAPPEPYARAEIKGAVKAFAAFEHRLNGWSISPHV